MDINNFVCMRTVPGEKNGGWFFLKKKKILINNHLRNFIAKMAISKGLNLLKFKSLYVLLSLLS